MDSLDEATASLHDDRAVLSPPWGEWGRSFTLGAVSGLAKLLLNVLNTTTTSNHDTWQKTVMEREPGIGLITICNHTSMFDDPGVLSAITPWWYFWAEPRHHGMRWSMCAKEVCFKNELLRQFFQNGKVLPIVRGAGVDQPIMHTAARQVAEGGWLHVFPEGRIMMNGQLGPFRWGVGKVVCDAKKAAGGRDPVILPFFHSNMGSVLPVDSVVPRVGKKVTVTIGQPLDLSDVTCRCNQPGQDQQQVWMDITLRMHDAMKALEGVCPPNPYQRENPTGKPGAEALKQTISIVVRDQTGGEVHFKVKPHTKFAKVFDAYCNKKAVATESIRFMFDGNRINREQTPAELEMADEDVIDAVVEQLGGTQVCNDLSVGGD